MADGPKNTSCCTPVRDTASAMSSGAPAVITKSSSADRKGMRHLEGGTFRMGCDHGTYPDDAEGPVREITLSPFYVDVCAVTNKQFDRFIKDTGYKTEAEKFGWSFVFHLLVPPDVAKRVQQKVQGLDWWWKVPGARWDRPEGLGTNVRDRMDHPAVHISWNDAMAYCAWSGKRLLTEAEFEYAARGGLDQKTYPWGDELTPDGEHRCNIWQGTFPTINTVEDGYIGTAPVRTFPPNGFGLFNMSGNAWQWCADRWSNTFHIDGPRVDPKGPLEGESRVMRGGSYLCHHTYCNRYRVSARSKNTPDSSTGNLGFRCAADV
jgi:sulfatase modifying factor 1